MNEVLKNMFLLIYEIFLSILIIIYEIIISIFDFLFQNFQFKYKSIRNEIVLITGAANGLGRCLCIKMAEQGCVVIGVDIDENGLCETKNTVFKLTNQLMSTYVCDIRFSENINKLGKYVKENFGDVDILINNAGIVHGKQILDLTPDQIKETFGVNTFSQFYMVQEFLPQMLKRSHGHIVFVASIAGYIPCPLLSDYCASKAANILFAETLMSELTHIYKNKDINVTIVSPFFIKTGMFKGCRSRFQFIIPDLTTEYVAEKIVQGIRKNQIHLSIGRLNYLLIYLKSILPVKAMMEIYRVTGCLAFLDNFVDNRGPDRYRNYQTITNNNNLLE